MYTLRFLETFKQTYKTLIKGQQEKEKITTKTLVLLGQELFYHSLKSHKVNTRSFEER